MVVSKPRMQWRRSALMIVEAAIVLPILLLLTFLLFQYGWLFLKAEQICNAARNGARRAIVADATQADVEKAIVDTLKASGMTAYYVPEIKPGVEIAKGEVLTVTVSVKVAGNPQLDLLGFSSVGGYKLPILPSYLRSSVSMAKEGA